MKNLSILIEKSSGGIICRSKNLKEGSRKAINIQQETHTLPKLESGLLDLIHCHKKLWCVYQKIKKSPAKCSLSLEYFESNINASFSKILEIKDRFFNYYKSGALDKQLKDSENNLMNCCCLPTTVKLNSDESGGTTPQPIICLVQGNPSNELKDLIFEFEALVKTISEIKK